MNKKLEAMKQARDTLEKGDLLCENVAWSILNEAIAAEEAQQRARPTNCGTGHCSCVECVMPEPRKINETS